MVAILAGCGQTTQSTPNDVAFVCGDAATICHSSTQFCDIAMATGGPPTDGGVFAMSSHVCESLIGACTTCDCLVDAAAGALGCGNAAPPSLSIRAAPNDGIVLGNSWAHLRSPRRLDDGVLHTMHRRYAGGCSVRPTACFPATAATTKDSPVLKQIPSVGHADATVPAFHVIRRRARAGLCTCGTDMVAGTLTCNGAWVCLDATLTCADAASDALDDNDVDADD